MYRSTYRTGRRVGIVLLLSLVVLAACSRDNAVTNFLSNTADSLGSLDGYIQGSPSTASACNPGAHLPPLPNPAGHLAGRSFTYLRGERAKGRITYNANGTFKWENENGTGNGTGMWSVNGTDWCESFDAGPHSIAISRRCWPVINFHGAFCFGITHLKPHQSGNGSATLY